MSKTILDNKQLPSEAVEVVSSALKLYRESLVRQRNKHPTGSKLHAFTVESIADVDSILNNYFTLVG